MIGKNVENKDYKDHIKEKRIIEKMKKGILNENLSAKDWEKFYKNVISIYIIKILIYLVNKSKKARIIYIRKIKT